MQIPILNGIFTDNSPSFRTSYPVNLVPVPKSTGISSGYLSPAEGIVSQGSGPGLNRGGITWKDQIHRVMGDQLILIDDDGTYASEGQISGSSRVSMEYGFDYLAIVGDGLMWLYNEDGLYQVTDPDLGQVLDVIWIDGYYMMTDGEFLIVSDLGDPFSINPLKYGSSEADPDPIKALLKHRSEAYALNRYTIEVFYNTGSEGFPFARVQGAQIQKGVVGTHACCVYADNIAFLGGGRSEAPAVWLGSNGSVGKISSREVDEVLTEYTENELSYAVLEERSYKSHEQLYIHLPRHTLVYDVAASRATETPTWFILSSSIDGSKRWAAIDMIWEHDRWNVADPDSDQIGYLSDTVRTHWGEKVGWSFGTMIFYNDSLGGIFHSLELVCLTGAAVWGKDPTVWTQYSLDGQTWSMERPVSAGKAGERNKRIMWMQQGRMENMRMQRFRGTSDAPLAIAALEARIEPLAF